MSVLNMNHDEYNQESLKNVNKQAQEALQQQIERQRLVMAIAVRIRESLRLNEVLNTTVAEVRQFLQADRVFIYRFAPNYSGCVVVESVGDNWRAVLNAQVEDTYFMETHGEKYRQGGLQAIADIYAEDISECHRDLLIQFQVKANLVVPILQGEKLWGLLVTNQCGTSRHWQSWEIDLLQQLATQVGIAIQQSELYEQVRAELKERKQAEQKVREQAALLDIATDAILVRDFHSQILFWNKAAERLYGWQAHEAIGKNSEELLFKESSSQLELVRNHVLEHGSWQGELNKITKSGKEIIVESRWNLMFDESGQPKSILTVDTDITEKKQLQAQFLRAQRMESLGTLASGIAHDLNNILTPIMASIQLLALKSSSNDARNHQLLKILEHNSKRAADLVKQILTFARGSETRGVTLQIEPLLLEIEQILNSTFPKSIKITKHLPPENLWTIQADPTQIHQVLMNLCVNARDAMPGNGTLSIFAENLLVDKNFAKMNLDAEVGPYVVITIADTGFGIPPLILERIFEPFFTTKESGKGTGLGLSTVIGIVKNHGGFVNVNSEIGKGSQFQVFLPAVEDRAKQQVEDLDLPAGQGELILIVDDEAAIVEITKTSLEDYNYKTLTAKNGIEAIALYAQHQDKISMVLMDIMMPSMDGLTAIRILQEMNPQLKIIAISGITGNNQLAEAANAGVNAFLRKPYNIYDLVHAIHNIFHQVTQ
ncbi:multi-sensor hybrid histidine kinase [Trichormus variabilis ATCC 29413]|uniref:histidine kinase n=2 Tax=Anabaena variabilis TaxID=264691 RepID=Q3M6L0_TRIV2|nr:MULTISPECIES: GAF domain-containing protein [Nostocaceae]ABA23376.1 multi-sensor hybrid histidine kinase [Trichormus variabilis ATCC 29413]QFZ14807.1 response regulator [Anabaena sp. YBS01]QHD82772.1 response regulator [Trichormus variabilis 0441]